MKSFPSINFSSDDKKMFISLSNSNYNLSNDRADKQLNRRTETKQRKKVISKDPVFLFDLPVASDYGKLLTDCIDPDLTLNTKGILSNLHYSFKAFEEDSGNGNRKVKYSIFVFVNYC